MIDSSNKKILNILQKNARTTNADIARQIGKAPSAVLERIRKLEVNGVIQGYEARVAPLSVGLGLTSFTLVSVEEEVGSTSTGELLASISGVLEVHYCAGQDSYLVKIRVENTEKLAEMLAKIGRIPTVKNTKSTIVLRTVKESSNLPIDEA
ncbi:Lrp/AsnC family transcriptional regulator [Paucidesulfovibrio longus]|uniref:Lrp/AsnC family transcriptional regulator n=1 Tax=Paucidesulfovibrio longus TaxID=889 RepID=UPI0003B2FBD5|nr:Lrp/AsnC family transcriptional regulator [Paucidesulfovibrio longus]